MSRQTIISLLPILRDVNYRHRRIILKPAVCGVVALFDLKDSLYLRPPIFGGAGQHLQVRQHPNRAADVGVAAQDEDLARRIRLGRLDQHVTHGFAGEERQIVLGR